MKKYFVGIFLSILVVLSFVNFDVKAFTGNPWVGGEATVINIVGFTGTTRFNITSNYNNTFAYPSSSMTWATDGSKGLSFSNSGNGCLAIQINGTWTCQ
jgi:hypothetical protein